MIKATGGQRKTVRMPATKFGHLRRKLQKQPITGTPRKKGR
jgi:hypothetical protein